MSSFVEIGPPVAEENIFEVCFYHIWAWAYISGHVTCFIYMLIGPPSYRCFIYFFALIGQAVSEKIFENVNALRHAWTHGRTHERRLDYYPISSP